MTNVLSKFRAMGVPLNDLIRRSTVNPAREIHRPELGTLSVGKEADVAVLEELHGKFGYIDCGYAKMNADVQIVARITIRAGRILYDPSGLTMTEWRKRGRNTSRLLRKAVPIRQPPTIFRVTERFNSK